MRPSQGRGCFRKLPDVGFARLEAGELAAVGVLEVTNDGPAPFPEDFAEVHGEVVVDDWPLADGNLVRTEEESHVRGEGEALPHRLLCTLLVVADTAQGKHCEGLPVDFPLQPSHKRLREDLREKGAVVVERLELVQVPIERADGHTRPRG